jgi:hypothetical protein
MEMRLQIRAQVSQLGIMVLDTEVLPQQQQQQLQLDILMQLLGRFQTEVLVFLQVHLVAVAVTQFLFHTMVT